MHVVIIGINYRPELAGIGPYTSALAEHLVTRGDRVTVVTGIPHYPEWRSPSGKYRHLFSRELIAGVSVIRAAHFVPAAQSAVGRATYEGTFGLSAFAASLRLEHPDAILGIVPSLSGGILARLTALRFRRPYGILFQDMMSRAAGQSGIAGGGKVVKATAAAEGWATRDARAVGVVAEPFAPYLESLGVPRDRIHLVPNWTRLTAPRLEPAETRAWFGWTDHRQVVLHAGNMGLKQGLDQVIEAARIAARRDEPVRFVFSGSGNQARSIQAAARDLPNVTFLGMQPDEFHASLLAAADVLLLSERPTQIDMSLPSKLTSYFAAGRPILAAVPQDGGSAAEVERSGAGLVVPAGDPELLLEGLARLRSDVETEAQLAAAGPLYVESHTTAKVCLPRALGLVDVIAGRASAPSVEKREAAA